MATSKNLTPYRPTVPANKYDFLKSPELKTAAIKIASIGGKMAGAQAEMAYILRDVSKLDAETMNADGFSGVGDFAEKLFNIKKAAASQLVTVAERFYTERPAAFTAMWPPYHLYCIRNATDEQINAALADGTISGDSTQAELKAWADGLKSTDNKSSDTKPLKTYDVECIAVDLAASIAHKHFYKGIPMETWDNDITEFQKIAVGDPHNFPDHIDGVKARIYAGNDGYIILRYVPVKKNRDKTTDEVSAMKKAKKMTPEERAAMLKALQEMDE